MSAASSPPVPASRATIDDVLHTARVSKATVSRFLNHRDKLLTPEIAARVEKAVAALGYVPSPMAQALKRGRSRLIGLVVAIVCAWGKTAGPAPLRASLLSIQSAISVAISGRKYTAG